MVVSELIRLLQKQDPNSRVLVNIVDDNKTLRKVPIRKVVNTDTGLKLHPTKSNGSLMNNFSMSGGDEKITFLT